MTCNRTTFKLIQSYLASLDTPRSLAAWIMFRENEHEQLLQLDIDPNNYLDPGVFRRDYLATKFLSKATFLSTSIDKRAAAMEAFYEAESSCREVNKDQFKTAYLKCKQFDWVHSATIRKIKQVLGDFTGDEFADCANWGPGVTLDSRVKFDTSATNKFRFEGGITRYLYNFIKPLHELAYPLWKVEYTFHIGNKIVTVPKNSKTDRTIAIEPGINLWYQKSIGTMIRRRLRRYGLDLNSQKRNQQLAKFASETGSLATIDFSNASDSISTKLVEVLIPPRWAVLMSLLRSGFGSVDGQKIEYEKFSSMGNGFTFELESLIFYSVAISVCSYLKLPTQNVSVYGDDVIIPVEAVNLFREMCEIYGLHVNNRKSFSSGHFRESCGEHYFAGLDCKPYFLKEVVVTESDIYLAANTIRRRSHNSLLGYCDASFEHVWRYLRSKVKRPCLISEGYGDVGFIVNFDEATPSKVRHGIEGYHTRALLSVPIRYYSDDLALLLARLKGRSVDISLGNDTNIRNRVRQLRKKLFVRRWADLGPWL